MTVIPPLSAAGAAVFPCPPFPMSTVHPEISKLVANGKLQGILAPRMSALEPGTYCFHKSWGVGRIAEWKLDADQVIVDFEDKKGHPLKVEFAAKSLDAVSDTHIFARRHADPGSLQKLAKDDKPALVRAVLESHKGSMSLDAFEAVVKPKIVAEGAFKGWWESCKKELRSRPEFIVPAKRNLPLELRGGDLSPEDEGARARLLADRDHAKKQRNFDAADGIRDDLLARYNVSIDDRSSEWRVDTNEYARRRPSSSSSGGGGDDYDGGGGGGGGDGGPAETLSEGEARYIDGRLKERFDLKRARLYGEADAIRDELMDRFGVQIDDRTKEWFVVSAEDAALSPA